MGYKKLDEVMELLTDELDGFNNSLDKLEKLTKDTDNIKIKPDISEIEYMLKGHLNSEKDKNSKLQESILDMKKQISRARLIPKIQLWMHYSIWLFTSIIISFLAFKLSRTIDLQKEAFAEGEHQVISDLRGYFDQNPEHYESYEKWLKGKDSVPNQK